MFGRTIIEDVKKQLEGTYNIKENELTVDIMDILDTLEPYEVVNGIIWDKEEETDYEYYIDDYLEIGLDEGWIEERNADNTYNWNAPLIHNIDFRIYYDNHEDEYIITFRIHCGRGDVRTGYSEWMYLKFDYEEEFLELFLECSKSVEVELNDEIYYVEVNALSDEISLFKYENGYCKDVCGDDDILNEMEELDLISY